MARLTGPDPAKMVGYVKGVKRTVVGRGGPARVSVHTTVLLS
jgi:hypothetical protein